MTTPRRRSEAPELLPRWRIVRRGEIALGPGKRDLLRAIARRGTLSEAARDLRMSYMRAWQLVKTMNQAFRDPLVSFAHGGRSGGGAQLTALGREVLELYDELERASHRAAAPIWRKLRRRLR